MLARAGILLTMAVQNIFLHRIKSLVVGGILFFGSLFLCTAYNLTRSVELSMAESIQGSLAGDFQIYDRGARDQLSLFGGAFFGREELGYIPDWPATAKKLQEHPDVASVVPMGFEGGFIGRGNDFDNLFEKLRDYVQQWQQAQGDDSLQAERERALTEHIALVRQNLKVLRRDLDNEAQLLEAAAPTPQRQALVDEGLGVPFWDSFTANLKRSATDEVETALTFLDTRVAPIAGDKPPVYLRYMGTDLERFRTSFTRFTLVGGEIPTGSEPWILLPERFYDTELKNLAAVSFDKISEEMRLQGLTPETSAALSSTIRQLPQQVVPLVVAIPPSARSDLAKSLADYMKQPPETPFEELIRQFLTVDGRNALERADWFAANIAPVARLHEIEIGEMLYLRGYTRTGFLRTVPLRVAGIYGFKGLSRSDIAGQTSIIDLGSYRELYGVMSQKARAELEELTSSVTISGVRTAEDSQSLEDSLFGSADTSVQNAPGATGGTQSATPATSSLLSEKPSDAGQLAINLAVILKDRSQAAAARPRLEKWLADNEPQLQLIDWKQASGLVGQLVTALRAVLLISVFVIMVVGATIINNSLMMSTLERTREIGTLRAIGADRATVTILFLSEIIVLAALAVYAGALASLALNLWLHGKGIPAMGDFVTFLFSGPRLFPYVSPPEHFITATILLAIAVVSSAFPARLASRIEPAVAMQEKE